ncbi:hypothetical protein EJB05_58108 [Eragrostis curvula]|uniref:C3H1-type domain-containing protein n=1 Tax=Eragrostis curvula TaxID=38414 RepID=A0A5J9SBT4_9POAL|nr:hypothetical protein EJB05_58108 [Eragrostis curvula]
MDMDECLKSLRNRVCQLHLCQADRIVAYIVSCKTPAEIKQYLLASDDQIRPLIIEAISSVVSPAQQFSVLSPAQPPSWGNGKPFPYLQPQVHPSVSSHGFHVPLPIDQIGPLHYGLPQFPPAGNFLGIQAPIPVIGLSGVFQSQISEFSGMDEHFQSLSIASDGITSNHQNAHQSVDGYPPSSSNTRAKPCYFHFYKGYCKKGDECRFSHVTGFHEMHNERRVHTPETLLMLDKEIRELLFSRQPSKVPIKFLANMYTERYQKPLWTEGSSVKGHQHESVGCSLTCLLLGLKTTRVISRQGQRYIVPMEDTPKYLADDFTVVMPPAIYGSNQIYITFLPKSTCTKRDTWNYFSRYGTVNDVRIIHGEKYTFGFVSFLCSETVKRILSAKGPKTPHIICGDQVFVKAYKEKHELEKFAKEDVDSYSGLHKESYVKVIHEHHTVTEENLSAKHQPFWEKLNSAHALALVTEKTSIETAPGMASPPTHYLSVHSRSQGENVAESLLHSNRLHEASADQDSDDLRLPESLDVISDERNSRNDLRLPESLDDIF